MATDAISALGAGSGVDVKALATSLVDAEKAPRKTAIDAKIKKSESGISGYAALKFVLGDLKTAFSNIKDQSAFNTVIPRVSQASAMSVTASATASSGSHTVSVTNLAKAQRSVSDAAGFATPVTTLNNGEAFSLMLKKGVEPTPTKAYVAGVAADPAANPPVIGSPSTSTITFKAMNKGDTVTVNGMTLTANKTLSKTDVGDMFANLASGQTDTQTNNTNLAAYGTFSGTFAAGYSSGAAASGVLTLTATANGANADIAAPTSSQPSTTIAIAANATTPAGMVAAINASNNGISAQLVNTGNAAAPYRIMLTGATGENNAFSITSQTNAGGAVANVNFGSRLQLAEDAVLSVDGMAMTSSSNRISDAIAGTTLELFTTTTGAANLDFSRDTSTIKTKIQALVTAFNDANSMLGVVSDPKSTVETYGATLVGNSIVGSVRNQMRSLITADSNSPSGGLTALRDIGLSINKTGELELDATKLDSALTNKYDNVVTLLTSNREKQSSYSVLPSGAAGEAVKKLTALLDTAAPINSQSTNLTTKITSYKKELATLDTRMTELLARYNKQFAAMESMVGQTKSLQTNLKSTFDGMMSVYTNK
jgi:flagellar hook-associated protein 2